jgi:hypothetical protein
MSVEQGKDVLDGDKKEDWMNAKWRPMMGWMYMLVCTCDFVVFPILWSIVQTLGHGRIETQWSPITLQGAGLFHMAMGAIIGVAAFGRTQEKLAGAQIGGAQPQGGFNNGGFNNTSMGGGSTYSSPQAGGFGTTPPAYGSTPAPTFGTPAPACPNTGRPLGPDQSFPAL